VFNRTVPIDLSADLPFLRLQPMKFTSRSLCLTVALGLTAGLAAPALAQNTDSQANPLADFQSQTTDPFASNSDASRSMMNLMQRVMQGERPDPAAFAASQQENMNDAMANFRAKQLQLIKAKQAQSPPIAQPGIVAPIVQPAAQPSAPIQTLLLPTK
jgi:hypothetical protein